MEHRVAAAVEKRQEHHTHSGREQRIVRKWEAIGRKAEVDEKAVETECGWEESGKHSGDELVEEEASIGRKVRLVYRRDLLKPQPSTQSLTRKEPVKPASAVPPPPYRGKPMYGSPAPKVAPRIVPGSPTFSKLQRTRTANLAAPTSAEDGQFSPSSYYSPVKSSTAFGDSDNFFTAPSTPIFGGAALLSDIPTDFSSKTESGKEGIRPFLDF